MSYLNKEQVKDGVKTAVVVALGCALWDGLKFSAKKAAEWVIELRKK